MTANSDMPVEQSNRPYLALIWDVGGKPVTNDTFHAPSLAAAKAALLQKYGEGAKYSLWNEDDAQRAR